MLQQTPRLVTAAPPSDVTLPPQLADVLEMFDTDAVINTGAVADPWLLLSDDFLQPGLIIVINPIPNETRIILKKLFVLCITINMRLMLLFEI